MGQLPDHGDSRLEHPNGVPSTFRDVRAPPLGTRPLAAAHHANCVHLGVRFITDFYVIVSCNPASSGGRDRPRRSHARDSPPGGARPDQIHSQLSLVAPLVPCAACHFNEGTILSRTST